MGDLQTEITIDGSVTTNLVEIGSEVIQSYNQTKTIIFELLKIETDPEIKKLLLNQLKELDDGLYDHFDTIAESMDDVIGEMKKLRKQNGKQAKKLRKSVTSAMVKTVKETQLALEEKHK